jgi:hypothetical protein
MQAREQHSYYQCHRKRDERDLQLHTKKYHSSVSSSPKDRLQIKALLWFVEMTC